MVDDFPFGIDKNGIRNSSLPIGIECINEFVPVIRSENHVLAGGLVFLEALQDGLLLIGAVERDSNEFKIAVTVHPVDGDELVEFRQARGAPGRP